MPDDPVAPWSRRRPNRAVETDPAGGDKPRIAELQARLYAEESRAVLIVLQGIDAAGKDSTVKHVFRGTNPQGVRATLEAMNPCWPRPDEDLEAYALEDLEESASSKR